MNIVRWFRNRELAKLVREKTMLCAKIEHWAGLVLVDKDGHKTGAPLSSVFQADIACWKAELAGIEFDIRVLQMKLNPEPQQPAACYAQSQGVSVPVEPTPMPVTGPYVPLRDGK